MFYLGPYEWREGDGMTAWRAPVGASPVVDLRSLPMQAAAGGKAEGFGIFAGPAGLGAEYVPLGEDINAALPEALRDAWGQRLGFSSLMEARTISEAIWETLTFRADPHGQDNAKPIMPSSRGLIVLHHAGLVRSAKFTPTRREFNAIQTVLQEDYRRIRAKVLDGKAPADLHQKVLGALTLKYGIADERVFIPADLPLERRKEPTTTIQDDFTRADGDEIGNQLTWVDTEIFIVTRSNRATTPADSGWARSQAQSDLSSDDHYAQVDTIAVSSNGGGPIVRFDDDDSGYMAIATASGATLATYKFLAGSNFTAIGTNSAFTFSNPDTVKIQADGSTITRYLNGAEVDSTTDTSLTGQLRCGITINGPLNVHQLDNFEAADLAAAGGAGYRRLGLVLDGIGL
jgi:hypothetical protein